MKKLLITTLIALLVACGGDDKGSAAKAIAKLDNNSPDGALMAVVEALKANDIKSLIKLNVKDDADYNKMVSEFEKAKLNISDSDKAQFEDAMSRLTAAGAEDQIMAMAEPQLAQVRQQLPMMLMMGKGMMSQAIQASTDIPDGQKETTVNVLNAVLDFVGENDVLSEEVTRKAISAAINTAKSLDMTNLDSVKDMSFDDAVAKAGLVMGGTKNILNAYGISLDDMLNSIKLTDVETVGDSSTMKLAYEFLGQAITQDVKMENKDGKWVTVQ